jgi:CheY-like chemotaxis protein
MSKDKILIYEDIIGDFQKLAKELTKTNSYDVIPSIDPDGKYPYDELRKSFVDGTSFEYVNKIIRENWNDGLKIIICDLLVKGENLGRDLIEKIRCDENFCINECRSFSALIPIVVYTRAEKREPIDNATKSGANFFVQKPIDTVDPRMERANKKRMEDLKEIIKQQINFFDAKLDLLKNNVPEHIKEEVRQFKTKNKGETTAFIMTPFTDGHMKTVTEIKKILNDNGIIGCVADAPGGEYHDGLLKNVQVFLHGCDFGIAIYDNILGLPTSDRNISPNVSLEVGYMLAMQKSVAFLKDKSLPKLNSDLDEKIYIQLDMDNLNDLEGELVEWLKNKGFLWK